MGYKILGSDFGDFISSAEVGPVFTDEEQVSQTRFATPKGDIFFAEQFLSGQLSILEGDYSMQDDVTIFGKGDDALLEIQFNLSDKDIFYRDKSMAAHTAPTGSGNIAYLSKEENEASILFQKQVAYHTFDIHLPVTLLDQYAGESKLMDHFLNRIHRDISSRLTERAISLSPAIFNTIQAIKNCSYEGLTRRIYLESKAYEIIALLYENIENQYDNGLLRPADQEKIRLAASMIANNLEQPFTIFQLSRLVGVNQTKLKTGFKALFGTTVFGYLQDIRMQEAKRYLLDTRLSIQEIGLLLGYQNTSNFSVAFKKVHGYPPMKLRERRA